MKNPLSIENNVFSAKDFKAPSLEYAPSYNWIWNGPLSHEETDRQLDEFERLGIRSFCMVVEPKDFRPMSMPSLLTPDYLTKPYFEEYRYAVESAKRRGMRVWLYDEGGWPSGGACGKVMQDHPEYARRKLDLRKIALKAGETYKAKSDTLAAYIDGQEIADGFTASEDCTVLEYYERVLCFDSIGIPDIPDVTRKEAVDYFLEITHEAYKPYLQEFFGSTMPAVFSDEPKGPSPIPFRAELEEAFLRKHGYSIRPYLPYLLTDGQMPEDAARAKIAWLDLAADFFCQNYLQNERAWCHENGLLFTGHVGGDHSVACVFARCGYYHILRALRSFDIPGIDVIWRQIYPTYINNGRDPTDCNNGIFPRFASSAASQIGARRVMTESMGVYGAGTTFNDVRYVLGYQAVRGVNLFNIFGTSYSRKGFHMMGEMPFFTEKHACYRDLPALNRYVERLSYLASLGERASDVAYYLPVPDLWVDGMLLDSARATNKLGDLLEDENVLFDVIDDDVLRVSSETAQSGRISMGKASYHTVILPYCRYMPEESKETLRRFMAGGGKVFIVSEEMIDGLSDAVYVKSPEGILPRAFKISGDTEKIRLGIRKAEGGNLYILFNESENAKAFRIDEDKKLVRLYAESGRIVKHEGGEITLACGESAFFYDGEVECEMPVTYRHELPLDGEYSFRATERMLIGEMEYITEKLSEPEKALPLGDWSDRLGIGFSGSGIYKTSFRKPATAGALCLDLGEVRYSCEVFLNGHSLGILPMSPYRVELPTELVAEENTLEIRVSNTAANEYERTTSFDKWKPWQLSTYLPTQKTYHAFSLSGGLFGPVKILY